MAVDIALLDKLSNHILSIFDNDLNEIDFESVEIKNEKRKYSSVYSNVLYINGNSLSNKQQKTYKVKYKCRCGAENVILLHKYLNKHKLVCQHCLQNRKYDDCIITNNFGKNKGKKTIRKINEIKKFNELPESFKEHYVKIHLSTEEFFKYIPFIYQLNDTLITEDICKTIKYYYAEPINNQCKFVPYISFDNGLTKETIKKVLLKCSVCNSIFSVHLANLKTKNLQNIKCQICGLTNYRYKIQKYFNLTFQSKLEKTFIDKCLENNIEILNGLKIQYIFNNKKHTYITDFLLPEFNYIIEIKSNNIWYRNDVNSGKFDAKVNAANEYAKNNNLHYIVLFDNDIDNFILNIKRDSLEKLKNFSVR